MYYFRLILVFFGTIALGQSLQAAQQSQGEVEAKRKAERQISEYGREEVRKAFCREISKLESRNDWPRRKKFIHTAVETYGFQPDDIVYYQEKYTPLFEAVVESDYDFCKFLLQHKANPNATSVGNDCLSQVKDTRIAQALIKYGANVQKKSFGERNVFYQLFLVDYPELALTFFKAGANPQEISPEGYTPLSDHIRRYPLPCRRAYLPRFASIMVRLGMPLDTCVSMNDFNYPEFRGKNFKQMLQVQSRSYDNGEVEQLLEAVDSAKKEVDKAQIDRVLGLFPMLKQSGYFCNDTARLVFEYNDPNDHVLPVSIAREMEEQDKKLEAENQSNK